MIDEKIKKTIVNYIASEAGKANLASYLMKPIYYQTIKLAEPLNYIYLNIKFDEKNTSKVYFDSESKTQELICNSVASKVSNICDKCNYEIKERELFSSKYVGCMC